MKYLLGLKLGMTQIFDEKGKRLPVTLVEAGPGEVLQMKTRERDGYEAVQLGFIPKKKHLKKTDKGKAFRYIREHRGDDLGEMKAGDKVDVSVFQEGDKVKVVGTSKGKGFQGAVKRWGFTGRNATHGVKHEHRTVGSIGPSFPERVIKGKKMPGRMGFERVTVKGLKIVKIDKENNLLALKGAVPGPKGSLVEIYES